MKQIKKMSLSNMISKLTRNEMRYVMAGSGDDDVPCPAEGTYTPCDDKTVCKTDAHPNSYCATTSCKTISGSISSFKSCNYYA